MSYILDALKRADAERGRGAVPGLHARQVATPVAQGGRSLRSSIWLTVAALALGAIATGLWLWQTPADNSDPLAAAMPVAARPTVAAPLMQPVPIPPPVAPALPALPTPPDKPPAITPLATKAPPTTPVTPLALPAAKTSATRPAPTPVPLLRELAEDIRLQIPPLTITGVVYSENPGQRLLLVNNQVLNQGGVAAPEVTVEEIQPKSSIFSFKGTRFRVAH